MTDTQRQTTLQHEPVQADLFDGWQLTAQQRAFLTALLPETEQQTTTGAKTSTQQTHTA